MITTANYIVKVVAEGETYVFEYETGDVWTALDEFWHEDWDGWLSDKMMTKAWPLDVMAMDDGKVIKTYELAFEMSYFHHFYDHGHITLNEFDDAIRKIRADLDTKKSSKNDVTEAKEIIALWSDWCMDWDDENLWLDYMVKHPRGHCNRRHLQEKWDYCYEKYGSKAAMTMFWRELDNVNRAILTEYVTTQWHNV